MHGAHRLLMIGRCLRVVCVGLLAIVFAAVLQYAPAHAEQRVAALTRMLSSSSDKTRLSAVLALAKLAEPAAQKALVGALNDPSARVRVVAATALGRLACEAALPRLRTLASEDTDDDVRKAAGNAAMKIARASRPADDRPARSDGDVEARRMAAGGARPVGRLARPDEPHPDLYVLINSSSDDSPGIADKAARKQHADIIKRVLMQHCRAEPSITSTFDDAQRWDLIARHIDLSVTRLDVVRNATAVEIDAQLRLAISDDSGKMLSFLSGGAKVQVGNQTFDPRYLPALRKEALENAMRGMFDKLLRHLRDHAQDERADTQ
jgi:hypothetical protein